MSVTYTALESTTLNGLGIQTPTFDGNPSFYSAAVFIYTTLFIGIICVAFYELVLASWWRMQGSPDKIRMSDEAYKKVTLGLLGTFGMFLLLVTLNKDLLKGDIGLDYLKANPVTGSVATSQTGTQSSSTPPTGSSNYQARVTSHNAVVARLAPSGIHTNHGDAPCTEAQFQQSTPSCTSLAYLPEETIQMLLSLNAGCGCSPVISGGTEPGHISHGENRRPVDIQITSALTSYLNTTGNKGTETNGCNMTYIWHGFTFCDEKPRGNSTWAPHYHVS